MGVIWRGRGIVRLAACCSSNSWLLEQQEAKKTRRRLFVLLFFLGGRLLLLLLLLILLRFFKVVGVSAILLDLFFIHSFERDLNAFFVVLVLDHNGWSGCLQSVLSWRRISLQYSHRWHVSTLSLDVGSCNVWLMKVLHTKKHEDLDQQGLWTKLL